MAIDSEEFEMLLNDYGIVVSERTRRLIRRNHMKKLGQLPVNSEQIKKPEYESVLCNIIKSVLMFLVNIIYTVFTWLLWVISMIILLILYILKLSLEIMTICTLAYLICIYVKQIEQSLRQ